MKTERTLQGLVATVKSSGTGRFSTVAFLSVWLSIWTAGEIFVLWFLLWGGWCVLTGRPPGEGRGPLELAPSLMAGLFLLFWLALWTLGGVLAWRELLRILFGADRLTARPDALQIEHSYGLFRTRQSVRRDQLIRFYLPRSKKLLSAETSAGTVEIVRLGTGDELADLALTLNTEFGLSPESPSNGILPEKWREEVSGEGQPILLKNPTVRRQQTLAVWLVFASVAFVTVYLLSTLHQQSTLGWLGAVLISTAGFVGWNAYRLTTLRDEWTLTPGSLVLQRRSRARLQPIFSADALQLREDKDSDGDPLFRLFAVQTEARNAASLQDARKYERAMESQSADPTELRSFGLWLAHRARLPFTDHTTASAKAEDFEKMKLRLAASGRIGQFASRLLGKLKPS